MSTKPEEPPFHQWGPSWDFTWDFRNWNATQSRPYFIAQLGDGDEANSLPVLIPREKALRVREVLQQGSWGGMEANITGLLGHREHFRHHLEGVELELFGGLLDYCLWLNEDDKSHCIQPLTTEPEVYSGYLWKCLAPVQWIKNDRVCINDVFFVWEHANLVDRDAVNYALNALIQKERYPQSRFGKLNLIQKSCSIVPGDEVWTDEEIYSVLLGKDKRGKPI